jgi:hypothetical protein
MAFDLGNPGETLQGLVSWLAALWAFLTQPVSNIAVLLSLMSGLWAWNTHRKENRFFPKIEFLVDVRFKVKRDNVWIAEAVCGIKNNGIARFSIEDLNFEVRGLPKQSAIVDGGSEIAGQTEFPEIVKAGKWFSSEFRKTFVEAGTTQIYRHVFAVPSEYDALLIHGSVLYAKRVRFRTVRHTADRLIRVPGDYAEAAAEIINEYERIRFDLPVEKR